MICEAFTKGTGSYRACRTCGHPYWVHSHERVPAEGHAYTRPRARHKLINRWDAQAKWLRHGIQNPDPYGAGKYLIKGDPRPDMRPRYQIMQERQVSISKFVAAHIVKGRSRQARPYLWTWVNPEPTRQDEVALDA
jgi:hypothetical protein